MLIAGLVTVIITFIRGYSIIYKLVSLLAVFLIFYFVGSVIVYFLDHFDKVNAERLKMRLITMVPRMMDLTDRKTDN